MITEVSAPAKVISSSPNTSSLSSDVVISLNDVGKMYRLFKRPQDRLKNMLFYRFGYRYAQEFWALQGITFEICKGETVGIIGRNGSGKSTLLQIIAGTIEPTMGNVDVRGRVAALLELGSGFNSEYSGRENVFLNGAVLGLTQEQMEERFDDIVSFADIGDFLDQPVKTYSTGMVMRLAFSVQAFVPKEVLIVDEALSVGDMFFSAKCMRRMKQMMDEGVTVLFVSHDSGAIKKLCRRAILLDHGHMITHGTADAVVEKYFEIKVSGEQTVLVKPAPAAPRTEALPVAFKKPVVDFTLGATEFEKRAAYQRIQNGKAHFLNVQLLNAKGDVVTSISYDQALTLRMYLEVYQDIPEDFAFGYHIRDGHGVDIVYSDSVLENCLLRGLRKGERILIDWDFRLPLASGCYNVAAVASKILDVNTRDVEFCDFVPLAAQFEVGMPKEWAIYGAVHLSNTVRIQRTGVE